MNGDSSAKQEWHLDIRKDGRLALDALAEASGLSRQKVKALMQSGAVWLTQGKQTKRLRRAKKSLPSGCTLHLYFDPKLLDERFPEPRLVADEGDYSVWDKPCGLLSQGSKWGDRATVARWAEQHLKPERPAFIVHRLDRATRGLMLIAHSKQSVRALTAMFEARAVDKRYQAVVHGYVETANAGLRVEAPVDGKRAVSVVRALDYDRERDRSLLEVAIETGRKHQIRRHLSQQGFPIVGDRLYGGEGDREDLQLASSSLRFTCPLTHQPRHYQLQAPLSLEQSGGESAP